MSKSLKLNQLVTTSLVIAISFTSIGSFILYAQDTEKRQSSKPPFVLTIRPVSPSVSAGAPVWVEVTVENKSDHDISVYRDNRPDQGGLVYKVDVQDEKGTTAPETKEGRREQGHDTAEEREREPYVILGSGGDLVLNPSKTLTDRVNVSRLYDLSGPGKYVILFGRFDPESKTLCDRTRLP